MGRGKLVESEVNEKASVTTEVSVKLGIERCDVMEHSDGDLEHGL